MKNTSLFLLFNALFLFFSGTVYAGCSFKDEPGYLSSTKSFTMAISGTISVPADIPVGSEIYRRKIEFADQGVIYVVCTEKFPFQTRYQYLTTPLAATTFSDKVYETGVPGIGVKFVRNNSLEDFPTVIEETNCESYLGCVYRSGWSASSRLVLVKTAANVTPGIVEGSKLPSVVYSFGQSGSMLDIYKVNVEGSVQVTSPTCDISPASQSMTVPMGQYNINVFTGKGATTAWKNASIKLNNCGQFYGDTPSGFFNGIFDGNSTITVEAGFKNNTLSITVTPLNGVEDAANGIMRIDSGAAQASGVGIQLSTREGTDGILDLTSALIHTLPKDGAQSITVPLFARYIQTADSVKAGKANGRLEYVITYN